VEVSRDQFDVFEHMHYVCFHYEFEHDPADPDEECAAGDCPSAAVNLRPDRRPGTESRGTDELLPASWIWSSNFRRFCELVSSYAGYRFDDLDWQAVETGLGTLANEGDTFTYPIIGRRQLTLTVRVDLGSDEVSVQVTGHQDPMLGARIAALTDAFQ
jgi:hypothetical protein